MSRISKPVAAPPSGPAAVLGGQAQVLGCRCADTTGPPAMRGRRTAPAGDGCGPSAPSSLTGPVVQVARTQPGVDLETQKCCLDHLLPTTIPASL